MQASCDSALMSREEEIFKGLFLSAVENLQSILFTRIKDPDLLLGDSKTQEELLWEAETIGGADGNPADTNPQNKTHTTNTMVTFHLRKVLTFACTKTLYALVLLSAV